MKVKTETIIRTICLFIALINQLLVATGRQPIPFTDEETYRNVSTLITAIIAIWAWWKNNSFTAPAIKADEYMEKLRKEQ